MYVCVGGGGEGRSRRGGVARPLLIALSPRFATDYRRRRRCRRFRRLIADDWVGVPAEGAACGRRGAGNPRGIPRESPEETSRGP